MYAAGDIADCRKLPPHLTGAAATASLIAERLRKDKDARVLTLGDATYPVGLPSEFTNCYDPTWGQFKQRTHPAPGNHEYYSPHAMGYYRYFGDAAGPPGLGYYRFQLGKWNVISLNSYLPQAEHKAQLEWLEAVLEQDRSLCTLAYWHHPVFSSGGHGNNRKMADVWRLLQSAGAELVLAAHDHDYERFAPQDADGNRDEKRGIRQFVVGTGGAFLTPLFFRKRNSEARQSRYHGVLKLVLKDAGYEWEFLSTEDNAYTDQGSAPCR